MPEYVQDDASDGAHKIPESGKGFSVGEEDSADLVLDDLYKGVEPEHSKPGRLINRELSDLAFIGRVLEESWNTSHPLLERLRFLSISAEVLDQFYTVRVAKMRRALLAKPNSLTVDGLSRQEQLTLVDKAANNLMTKQEVFWQQIRRELKDAGIELVSHYDLSEDEAVFLKEYFMSHVFPVLSPLTVDREHPFPFIASGGICIVIELKEKTSGNISKLLIRLPHVIPRFVRIPDDRVRFVALETMIYLSWNELFPNHSVVGSGIFQILRDNDLALEERTGDLLNLIESGLERRHRANGIRLKVNHGMPESLRIFVSKQTGVISDDEIQAYSDSEKSVVESKYIGICGLLGLADTMQIIVDIISDEFVDLSFPKHIARMPRRLMDFSGDCFETIRDKDLLVHWPFESFDVLLKFLNQASTDEQVLSVKQTLYRTSDNSPIVSALVRAAQNGKAVTVVVELGARDNEKSNIELSRTLEAAGAQVIYGLAGLKIHCKATIVVRREGDQTVTYSHYGTGNYHPGNAKIYTDLSYFTCNKELGRDGIALFNYLTSGADPHGIEKLIIAPKMLRNGVLALIDTEIEFAKSGSPTSIWIKLNSLTDPEIIEKLYEASQAGVKIELIVRRHCSLRPGVKGLSENIRVRSIVGRFLEHSRIYCFGNGAALPSTDAKVFLGSADWMERNFDDRVELLVPIENSTVHRQILDQIMVANVIDTKQSWILLSNGQYKRQIVANPFCSQTYFQNTDSFSGLGSSKHDVTIPTLSLPIER